MLLQELFNKIIDEARIDRVHGAYGRKITYQLDQDDIVELIIYNMPVRDFLDHPAADLILQDPKARGLNPTKHGFEVYFKRGEEGELVMTGKGKAIEIMNFVVQEVGKAISEDGPSFVWFTSEDEGKGVEYSRTKLYRRLSKICAREYGYHIIEVRDDGEMMFVLVRQ